MEIFSWIFFLSLFLLCVPAWKISRNRKGNESLWLLFPSLPAIIIWVLLIAVGVGAQSMANSLEIFLLVLISILSAYIKVLIVDRFYQDPRITTYWLLFILVGISIAFRIFMPNIQE